MAVGDLYFGRCLRCEAVYIRREEAQPPGVREGTYPQKWNTRCDAEEIGDMGFPKDCNGIVKTLDAQEALTAAYLVGGKDAIYAMTGAQAVVDQSKPFPVGTAL